MNSSAILVSDEGFGGVMPYGKAIQEAGLYPVLFTGPVGDALLAKWSTVYESIHILADPYDPDLLMEQAASKVSEPVGLFSCYDGLVVPAALAAARLSLPHPDLLGLQRSRNKYATRVSTRRAGLCTPRFFLIESIGDCESAAAAVGFPAVLKPLNGMGSHLVRRIDDLTMLRSAYMEVTARISQNFPGNYSHSILLDPGFSDRMADPRKCFLLEQFISGNEYSAEVVVQGGQLHRVALFDKFFVDQNGFLERGFAWPATKNPKEEERIWQHIEKCFAALGVDDTTAHVEIFSTEPSPALVEINAGRTGGGLILSAVRDATGVDLVAETLMLYLGRPRPPRSQPKIQDHISVLTIYPPASGRLQSLDGLDTLASLPGVAEVLPFCTAGDRLNIEDREVFGVDLLVHGFNHDALRALYDQACSQVHFTFSQELGIAS